MAMAKTVLVLGPAGAGKTSLIRALVGQHRDHCWHRVQLQVADDDAPGEPVRLADEDGVGVWQLCCSAAALPTALPALAERVAGADAARTILALEAEPHPLLRHAMACDLRAFVLPPVRHVETIFRTSDESRDALQRIFRDSSALAAVVRDLAADEAGDPAGPPHVLGPAGGTDEIRQAQVEEFLACPVGTELAARVHLQPAFAALADADLVVLNTGASEFPGESSIVWRRLEALLARLHGNRSRRPLVSACDLCDPHDPNRMRVLRRLGDSLCGG